MMLKKMYRDVKLNILKKKKEPFYLVIRLEACETCGMFAIIRKVVGGLEFAINNGAIPVIDLKAYPNNMQVSEASNGWEAFFIQPDGICLEEVEEKKNKIVRGDFWGVPLTMDFFTNDYMLSYYRKIRKKYINYIPEIEEYIRRAECEILQQERFLGVLARGTDYSHLMPNNHPVQPSVDELIEKSYEVMERFCLTDIFLATEDEEIFQRFLDEFGSRMHFIEQERYPHEIGDFICNTSVFMQNRFQQNLSYLTSIDILSKCNCFISGRNGGAYGVMLFSEGFEYTYFWNKGNYAASDETYYKNKKI